MAFAARPYGRAIGSMISTLTKRVKFRDFMRYRKKVRTCVRRALFSRRTLGRVIIGFPLPSAQVRCAVGRTRSGG